MDKELISTAQAGHILGISRVAVFKRIKSGRIKARKIGRNYVIKRIDLQVALGKKISDNQQAVIEKAVSRAVRQYRETFRLLGQE